MSTSTRFAHRLAVLGGVAVLAASLTGCGGADKPATTSTPGSSAPASNPSQPTQKNLSPTGGNSFSPGVKATPPGTAAPGRHR